MIDVEVKPSAIEGLGLFTTEPCEAGRRLRQVNVVREVTPETPLRPDLGERIDHCDYADGKVFLLGIPDRYLNHSCDPNAYAAYEGASCFIVARRDIAAHEEITLDYNINVIGGSAWPCHCGATRCRGSTTGDFFLLPEAIQREYVLLLADWFVRSHAERLKRLFLVDHAFLAVSRGAPEVKELVRAGFAEGASNTHPGQGTACRRIFFENGYLELVWLEDAAEAASPLIERTSLAARTGGIEGASRIGICARPAGETPDTLPVATWPYRPPYLPAGMAIPVAVNSSVRREPLLFFPPPVSGRRAAEVRHPNGTRRITQVRVTVAGHGPFSAELDWLAGSGCVQVDVGERETLAIELDRGVRGGELLLQAPTPLRLTW